MAEASTFVDRMALRSRPRKWPLMHQYWGKLLFMHWEVDADALRPLIPPPLEIDTFDEKSWVGVIPFTMWGIRGTGLPPLPGLSRCHELNVRTYVHLDGVPGVWFFSLDTAKSLAVWVGHTFFHLPYRKAEMHLRQEGETIHYRSRREDRRGPPASFEASWDPGDLLPKALPGSLEFFLTERYCFYAVRGGRVSRCRIFHSPWPLQRATLRSASSTMVEAAGLPSPVGQPLLHYAESLKVEIWPARRL